MKGLIIAAGYGTRFLPATKTVPKEMLPLMDKPSIAFIVEEMIQSGIKDIVIITSRRKKCMDDFFDREVELERELSLKNKTELLEKIKPYEGVNICFIRQQEMKGVGHAMLQAESVIGNEPFVVAYPDDNRCQSSSLTHTMKAAAPCWQRSLIRRNCTLTPH